MDNVKGLCERLEALATRLQYDGTGHYGVETIAPIREAATALSTLSREQAEARSEIEFLRKRRGQRVIERDRARDEVSNAREILAGADFASLPADMPLAAIAEARMGDLEKARALAAEAASLAKDERIAALEAALDLYRDAVRIDVKMEGPTFMGANSSALKRAWEADRARSTKEQP